jgi:hypothetical protein
VSIQWHPILARLLRVIVEEYYEIDTNVAVGDVPRAADLVLLRRKDVKRAPFRRLRGHLTKWNVLEYKSRQVSSRREDLPLLVELGMGIARRLNQQLVKDALRPVPASQVSFWYVAHRLGKTSLQAAERLLRDFQPLDQGIWQGEAVGHRMFLVSSVDLPVDAESAPLSMLSNLSREQERALAQVVWEDPKLRREYRSWLWAFHRLAYEELRRMSRAADKELIIDLRPLIEHVGVREAIEHIGLPVVIKEIGLRAVIDEVGLKSVVDEIGLKSAIDEVGLKSVIDEVGVKAVIDEVGVKSVIEEVGLSRLLKEIGGQHLSELSPDERCDLKQWLEETRAALTT